MWMNPIGRPMCLASLLWVIQDGYWVKKKMIPNPINFSFRMGFLLKQIRNGWSNKWNNGIGFLALEKGRKRA